MSAWRPTSNQRAVLDALRHHGARADELVDPRAPELIGWVSAQRLARLVGRPLSGVAETVGSLVRRGLVERDTFAGHRHYRPAGR